MIGFVGLSHLGIVTSIATASKGFDVLAFDPNPEHCAALAEGRLPFFEPNLDDLLKNHHARIRFTANAEELKRCDVIYFSRDVPTDKENRSDLAALQPLLDPFIHQASPGTTLVLLSQVPPGYARYLAKTYRAAITEHQLKLYYQVETLIFGRAVERALQPERTIVGCDDPAAPLPAAYDRLLQSFHCPIMPMRYESAELTKISINLFLVSSVAVTNTLAELCEKIGADWSEIAPTLRLDRRIGTHAYLSPGLGIAGGNLERDLITIQNLAIEHGTEAGIVKAWFENSRHCRDWVLKTFHTHVAANHSRPALALWGLAYKQDTTSTKNSAALFLLDALHPFTVRAYDPQVVMPQPHPANFTQAKSPLDAAQGADVLAIMTPWREFSTVDLHQLRKSMKGQILIDPYGTLDRKLCHDLGFTCHQIGKPSQTQEAA